MAKQLLLTVLATILLLPSCKKDKDPTPASKTTREKLLGEWVIHHEAEDDNGNEQMEESEKGVKTNFRLVFEESGNVAMIHSSGTDNLPWTLDGNNITINPNGSQPKTYNIEEITDTELRPEVEPQ